MTDTRAAHFVTAARYRTHTQTTSPLVQTQLGDRITPMGCATSERMPNRRLLRTERPNIFRGLDSASKMQLAQWELSAWIAPGDVDGDGKPFTRADQLAATSALEGHDCRMSGSGRSRRRRRAQQIRREPIFTACRSLRTRCLRHRLGRLG